MDVFGAFSMLSIFLTMLNFIWVSSLCITGRKRARHLRGLKWYGPILLFLSPVIAVIAAVILQPYRIRIYKNW